VVATQAGTPGTAGTRLRGAVRTVRSYVGKAPGTFLWLAILFATSLVIRYVSPGMADHILERRSTNLHYLSQSPVRVLVTSAMWIAGSGWFSYFVLYNIFHVPAERWLGTKRWLAVVAVAHVGATYISEGLVSWRITQGYAPESQRYTLDYGVSYALAGVIAVLTYRIAKPWRYVYVAGVLVFYGLGVLEARDFTSIGHFSAVLLGLACYPITRARPGVWDPVATARSVAARVRATRSAHSVPARGAKARSGR
jgi:hypothetical protein